MSEWIPHILTKAGRKLQAKVEAGATLALTRMKLGSGLETIEEVDDLTDLVAAETSLSISSAQAVSEMCAVDGILNTANLEHGFYCRELGLFADDPDDGEILYAIMLDGKPDWLPANLKTSLTLTDGIKIAIANATNITVQIDPAGLVDVDMLNAATHAVQRGKAYTAGQIATSSTLASGLMLQCATGGTTAETLIDWSQYGLGDTVEDGEVTWNVVQYQVTDGTDLTWQQMAARENWLYKAVSALRTVVLALKQGPVDTVLTAVISSTQPEGNVAWFKVDDETEERAVTGARMVLADGTVVESPLLKLAMEDGSAVYVDTSGDPSGTAAGAIQNAAALLENLDDADFGSVTGNSDIATEADIDAILNQ